MAVPWIRQAMSSSLAGFLLAAEQQPGGEEESERPDGQRLELERELVDARSRRGRAVAECRCDRTDRGKHIEEEVVEEMRRVQAPADQEEDPGDDGAHQRCSE